MAPKFFLKSNLLKLKLPDLEKQQIFLIYVDTWLTCPYKEVSRIFRPHVLLFDRSSPRPVELGST